VPRHRGGDGILVKTELIFVRHGSTESNERGLLHGRTDIPLAGTGIQQAKRVAERLAKLGRIDSIYSSPLERAYATAREIGVRTGLNPVIMPELSEFDFGDLEGLSFEELQIRHPELYLSMMDPNEFDRPFPNGESRSELHQRVVASLDQITRHNGDGRVVVVAHLVVIATAVAHLTTGDQHDIIRFLVRNCSVTHLEFSGRPPANVQVLDDVSHLE
jgi:broad specificity phosphatase PhoE